MYSLRQITCVLESVMVGMKELVLHRARRLAGSKVKLVAQRTDQPRLHFDPAFEDKHLRQQLGETEQLFTGPCWMV